jgi:hypothetical protein
VAFLSPKAAPSRLYRTVHSDSSAAIETQVGLRHLRTSVCVEQRQAGVEPVLNYDGCRIMDREFRPCGSWSDPASLIASLSESADGSL